jgi:ABC-2 type transport system permease protein
VTSLAPTVSTKPPRTRLVGELAKLPAFLRRDLLVAWSYRVSFVTEWISLAIQATTFYFVSKLIRPEALPAYGGTHATYMQFVSIGILVSALLQLAIGKIASGMRGEQMMGTLESLLLTPTSSATVQAGTVAYDFIYIPIRLAIFLVIVAVTFGLQFDLSGIVPSVLLLLVLLPFVWGIGIANAAATLTFRRGGSPAGIVMTLLALGSGAYFPLTVFPGVIRSIAEDTPIAVALNGIRRALIGGDGWAVLDWRVALLAGFSAVSLACGLLAFRLALRREWRRGSLGLY